MAMATVNRRWTIATWLVAGAKPPPDGAVAALAHVDADAIALQSVGKRDVDEVAAALGMHCTWACSHYPRTRLFPGSAVGLAVLTPHRISFSDRHVVTGGRSAWSRSRRIAQNATVERSDHSAYTISHAAERVVGPATPSGAAPSIIIRPPQVGVDDKRAIELPTGASMVTSVASTPIERAAAMLVVTFEMPWVQGDFPT
jgi:hypothetical protein